MTTLIKICGITHDADADAVVAAGADAVGLNFVPQSPRRVAPAAAAAIARRVEGELVRVGVFADAPADEVRRVLDTVPLDALQFHGSEAGDYCRSFGVPWLKALRVREPLDVAALEAEYAGACCLLLDAYVAGVAGGTGHRFDWDLWPGEAPLPLVLSGGLTPDTVGAALVRLRPWGVDVSSGVEGACKGRKDTARVRQFVRAVRKVSEREDARS